LVIGRRDVGRTSPTGGADVRLGLKAGAIMFLKVGQFQPLLHVGRWRWKAALAAAAAAAGLRWSRCRSWDSRRGATGLSS